MRIKTKTYFITAIISILFLGLYVFVLSQLHGLDGKITKAMLANRIRELVAESRQFEQDYLRTGDQEKIKLLNSNLRSIVSEIRKKNVSSGLAMPGDAADEIVKLTHDYQTVFESLLPLEQKIAAAKEILGQKGNALEKTVTEAFAELKKESPSDSGGAKLAQESLASKVDKITLAHKILNEGYGISRHNREALSRPLGRIQAAVAEMIRRLERDALIEAASAYAASFKVLDALEQKAENQTGELRKIAGHLEALSSKNLAEMNKKRDEAKEAMMMAIVAAFTACGFLVLLLSFWFGSILTGAILRLRQAMLRIAGGDLTATIDVHSRDEIGDLAESFRTMGAKLRDLYNNLHETNEKLEAQTQALARSNRDLDRYSEELREANARLKKLDELKSRFISTASHELKTPLTSLKGYVEIILNGEAGPINDEQKEYLGYVKESTDRLYRLVKELLNISKIESGQAKMVRERTDLRIVVKEEVMLFKPKAQEKGTELLTDIDPALNFIYCDSDKIREVLDNLLSNAIKYTPQQGRIEIFARNHELGVLIGVQDNGIGIRKEDQKRIFDPFQYIEKNGTDHDEESTGLGLTLVKRIVEAHGGQIHVESAEGQGSIFSVILPFDMKQAKLNDLIGRDL